MSQKHTPGPWTVDDGGIRCDHRHNYGIVAQVRDGHVYSEYTSDSPTLEFRNGADALLIEAAPEMLVALKAIVDFCDDPDGSEKAPSLAVGLSGLLPDARAAIAKATRP